MSTTELSQPIDAHPTDAQLIAASRFDGVHFAAIYDRHAGAVHRYLDHRLGAHVAPVQLAEVFAAAYGGRRHFRSWDDSARPWLLGVATGIVRKQWRLEQAQLRVNASRRDALAIGAAAAGEIIEYLQHLDSRDRDVVLLVAWEELEPGAVARALDLPDGAVAARLDGMAREIRHRATATRATDPVHAVTDGVGLVRALVPRVGPIDPGLAASVRRDLLVIAGCPPDPGARRPTSAVAAQHEQQRRWRTGPGAVFALRRSSS